MSRPRTTRASSSDNAVTIQASSSLMDDFIVAFDLTEETDLTAVPQADGTYSLLYIGAFGNVMSLRQDPNSATGWTEEDLNNTPVFKAEAVGGVVDEAGCFVVFAVRNLERYSEVYFATRQANGWSAWQQRRVYLADLTKLIPVRAAGNTIDLWTSGSGQSITGLWRIRDITNANNEPPRMVDLCHSNGFIEPCTIAGVPYILYFRVGESPFPPPSGFDPASLPSRDFQADLTAVDAALNYRILASDVVFTSSALGTQHDGNPAVFIADNGGAPDGPRIAYLDGGNPSAGFVTIDTKIKAQALAVASAGATPLALFALDEKSQLQFVALPTSPASATAFDFFLQFKSILCATGKEGEADLVGYALNKGLTRLWQSPAEMHGRPGMRDTGGWTQQPIEYDKRNRKPTQHSTYSTTLTFYDAAGAVIHDREVHLKSSEIVSARIGGKVLALGPERATICRTDAAGRVRVTTPTQTLTVAGLSARIPDLMAEGEDFAIAPNAGVQERLRKITVCEVGKLIPPKFAADAEQIQKAVSESMGLIHDGPAVLVRRRVDAGGDLRTALPFRQQPSQPFRFTVSGGRAIFKRLNAEEADAAIADMVAQRRATSPDFNPFDPDDWEEAAGAMKDTFNRGVDLTYDYVVKPVKDGFELAFTLITDTLTLIWNGTVNTLEAAFRFVEMVFNAVQTFFENLYKFLAWLLSNARAEIWATKREFERAFNAAVNMLADAARGTPFAPHYFGDLAKTLDATFNEIEGTVRPWNPGDGMSTSIPSVGGVLGFIEDLDSVGSWFFDKLADLIAELLEVDIEIPPGALEAASKLKAQLSGEIAGKLEDLMKGLIEDLTRLAGSVGSLGGVSLADLLKPARDVMVAVLNIIDSIVGAFLEFVAKYLVDLNEQVLNTRVGSWPIQALYELINPDPSEPLTLRGMIALLCAFPVTIIHRALYNEAPFSPDADATAIAPARAMRAAGFLQLTVWSAIDLGADLASGSDPILLGELIVVPSIIQALTVPQGSDQLKWASWGMGFVGPLLVLIWAVYTGFQSGPRGNEVGRYILAAAGAATLVLNALALKDTEPPPGAAGWLNGILGPFSAIGKPAKPNLLELLAIMDIVSNSSAGGAKVALGA
jgi:hypothetical protein